MKELTKKQIETLEVIERLTERNGLPPSLREIQREMGLANQSTVSFHVSNLRDKGYITYEPNKKRTIKIIKEWRGIDGRS